MKRNLLRVLFFLNGPAPTAEQREEADAMISGKVKVSFRNAQHVGEGDSVEKCDYVAGEVPTAYTAAGIPNFSEYKASISGKPTLEDNGEGEGKGNDTNPQETPEQAAHRAKREENNSQAKQATVAELKQALSQLNIKFEPTAKKADLLKLYLARPAEFQ